MGCDYYVVKQLEIVFHNDVHPLFMEVDHDKHPYYFLLDEDDPDYHAKEAEYIKYMLTPNMKPIIIYQENHFLSKKLEDKYKHLIDQELVLYNKYNEHNNKEWKDIQIIIMAELRFERK